MKFLNPVNIRTKLAHPGEPNVTAKQISCPCRELSQPADRTAGACAQPYGYAGAGSTPKYSSTVLMPRFTMSVAASTPMYRRCHGS